MRRRLSSRSEEGFTLIELVIVVAIMPIIIGALTVGMLSIFSLNSSVTGRLTDSSDAQQVSLYMQNDIQSATRITTAPSPTTSTTTPPEPSAPCLPTGSSETQILAVQLGNGDEVTYAVFPSGTDKGDNLSRNVCEPSTTTPSDSKVIAHDIPPDITTSPNPTPVYPFTICSTSFSPTCPTATSPTPASMTGWISAVGITSVTFNVKAPDSSYQYQVTAVPAATINTPQPAQPTTPVTGCGFAIASSVPINGAGQICFVDFTPWNPTQQPADYTCQAAGTNQMMLPMSENITNTPFTLEFCMYVSAVDSSGNPINGETQPSNACGVTSGYGYNDIVAVALPTYSCINAQGQGSAAFLGNNGFYTGVPGAPALYTQVSGSTATVTINSVQLVNSNDQPVTGWQLVTGDAESTDGTSNGSESISWTVDPSHTLSLLPNSPNSPIGNACGSTGQYAPPNYNSTQYGLSGANPPSSSVTCTNPPGTPGVNHTGTPMLESAAPSSLQVVMQGSGLQAMFLGVILP